MNKQARNLIVILVGLLVLITGCRRTPASEALPTAGSTVTATIPVNPKATAHASQPAAGICAEPEGEIVDMYANPDVPNPRCMIVRPDQKLRVHNRTQVQIDIDLGTFSISLAPGISGVLDQPFGEYLESGVHLVMVSPCCGGEIWLKAEN